MNEVLIRIRKIFTDSGENQTKIGEMIGKTPQYVWKLLNDDEANPSKSTIKDICREFSISEKWMFDGIGEMCIPPEDEDAAIVEELLGEPDNELYSIIKGIMKTYQQLDEAGKTTVKSFAKDLMKELKKAGD